MKVGIVGASGYAGGELLRLCACHPELEAVVATSAGHAGEAVGAFTPSLSAAYPSLRYGSADPDLLDGLDVVFCAMPHGASQRFVPTMVDRVGAIVDLAADFRLSDPGVYSRWYPAPHSAPALVDRFAYGLPELFRSALGSTRLVAAAGCYPTAAAIALAPLVRARVVEPTGMIVDAASGVSGAGRSPSERLQFSTVDGSMTAYGLLDHRHTPEMEQSIGGGAEILFTPHLAPMARGILATCYARPTGSVSTSDVLAVLRDAYDGEPFVVVGDDPPSTKSTLGSNSVHLTARADRRTGWVVVLSALDNLVKGAAGQAIQCANILLGLPETTGLPAAGIFP